MRALGLHDLVEQGDVKRHHGDRGTGLRDQCLVHGNPGLAADRGQLCVEDALHALHVLLGTTDGAVLVDRPGDFRADVAVGHGLHTVGQHARALQRVDPHLPILAAHDRHRLSDVVIGCGLDGHFVDHAVAGVEVLVRVTGADGLQAGFENLARLRVGAAWGGQRVDHAIDLPQVLLDRLDHLRLHRIRESVAVERAGVEASGLGLGFKRGGIVPARRAAALRLCRFFEKYANGRCAGAKRRRNAGGEAVASRGTYDQHLLRSVGDGAAAFDDGDLVGDMLGAARRVRGGADESTNFWGDDHSW